MGRLLVFGILIVGLVAPLWGQNTTNTTTLPRYMRLRIQLDESHTIAGLGALGLACNHGHHKVGHSWESDFSAAQYQSLQAAGYAVEVVHEDVQAFYQRRNAGEAEGRGRASHLLHDCSGVWPYSSPSEFQLGSMGGFFTYQEMLDALDSMKARYPHLISTRQKIHPTQTTVDGNALYWVRISDQPEQDEHEPSALYSALHHAREPISLSQMIYFMWYLLENYQKDPRIKYLVDNTELFFVPCVNPDGYKYNAQTHPNGGGLWRKNRRPNADGSYGVDINRNYGFQWGYDNVGSSNVPSADTYRGTAAFSEVETQQMRDFALRYNFEVALNYHGYGNLLIHPWGHRNASTPDSTRFTRLSRLLSQENGYQTGTGQQTVGYTVNGDSDDWLYGEQRTKAKTFSMTPEVGDNTQGFWPAASNIEYICRETLGQNLRAAWSLLNYGEARDISRPIFTQHNNHLAFQLTRYGAQAGNLTIALQPLTTNIIQVGPAKTFQLNIHETVTDSIAFTLSKQVVDAEPIRFLLQVDNGQTIFQDTLVKLYGQYQIVRNDAGNSLQNWVKLGFNNTWGTTTTSFFQGPSSITDSPQGNYATNHTNEIILNGPIDLSQARDATLSFYAKWDIEVDYDYAQVLASTDGTNFKPLCGIYTTNGSKNQDEMQPVYEGKQADWVLETLSLNEYLGERALFIKIRLVSDTWVTADGFYFDNLRIGVLNHGISSTTAPTSTSLKRAYPQPAHTQLHIPTWPGSTLEIFDALGRRVYHDITTGSLHTVHVQHWQAGFYMYRIQHQGRATPPQRILIH